MGIDEALALVMGPDLCGGEVVLGGTVTSDLASHDTEARPVRIFPGEPFSLVNAFLGWLDVPAATSCLRTTSLIN